jgi:hypothetical protein
MRKYLPIVFSIVSLFISLHAASEPLHKAMISKHTITVGVYDQDVHAGIFSRKTDGPSITVDTDKLGIGDAKTDWMLEYRYRTEKKWVFSASIYNYSSSSSGSVSREFEYDDVVFEAGVQIKSDVEIETYVIDALYKVYETDRAVLLVGGGLHLFDISTAVQARLSVDAADQITARASDDLLAPLPNLRLIGFYALSPKWAIHTTMGWLSFNYDDYDGAFSYIHLRGTYQIGKKFSVGLGYQYTDMDFTRTDDRGKAGIDAQFIGPSAFLAYSF